MTLTWRTTETWPAGRARIFNMALSSYRLFKPVAEVIEI